MTPDHLLREACWGASLAVALDLDPGPYLDVMLWLLMLGVPLSPPAGAAAA